MNRIPISPLGEDEKNLATGIQHVENHDAGLETEVYQARYKSRFDELSIPRTLWIFRRTVLVCLAVYTGYVCEGFEVGRHLRPLSLSPN
jgi:hypothetical protein